jgi:hypothetical protein
VNGAAKTVTVFLREIYNTLAPVDDVGIYHNRTTLGDEVLVKRYTVYLASMPPQVQYYLMTNLVSCEQALNGCS